MLKPVNAFSFMNHNYTVMHTCMCYLQFKDNFLKDNEMKLKHNINNSMIFKC